MPTKILIVDDDADSLKLIGLMLHRQGYEVVAANAGNQALARAVNDSPDLIILDVMMPDMDGYEVCRRLRSNPKTKDIPIIMFTAKTLIDDKVAGFEAGVDDYLTKPTHPAELSSRIKAILAKTRGNNEAEPAVAAPPPRQVNAAGRTLTIGVLGSKGGLGTTTLAVNLAAAMLADGGRPIVVDFQLGNGSLGLFLGAPNGSGMVGLLNRPAREITPHALELALVTHESGVLRALTSSPYSGEALPQYNAEKIAALMRSLRAVSTAVVFDLGSGFNPIVSQLQGQLDRLVLLVEPDPISIQLARQMLYELEGDKPGRVSVVVISRLRHKYQPSWQDVEKALEHEIHALIAPAPELAYEAVDAGVPAIMLNPESTLASQITKLAEVLAGSGPS
jgi:DNA-binding response OmpR family regulator